MGVRISELPETASAQTTDVIIISGEETKKISYASLLAQLRTDLNIGSGGGNMQTFQKTWNGLDVRVSKTDAGAVFARIFGTANAKINTKSAWVTVGNYAAQGITPGHELQGYAVINSVQTAKYRWTTSGDFQIGQVRASGASGSTQDIASGYVVYMTFAFAID
jgi:hypothetical protein